MTWAVGEARLFRWAHGRSLPGSPGWLVLLALGWTVEAVDDRYGSVLMCRSEIVPSPMKGQR